MAENPFTKPEVPVLNRALVAQADPVVMSGASWFWWIVGLSIINSIMIQSGTDRSFVIGLGFTLLADHIFREVFIVALVIDVTALSLFAGFGWLARKGHLWAFVTGIVLYGLDGVIYIFLQDWMSVGFHAFALFYMIRGARALREALRAAANPAPAIPVSPVSPVT
jgi:hypothetical protein